MDSVRKRIEREIAARGLDLKEVSLKIGRNHAYLQQFIKRGIPAKLNEDDRAKLAAFLDIPESELGAPKAAAAQRSKPGDVPQFNIHAGMGNGGLLSVEVDQAGLAIDPADSDGFWSFPESVKAGWRRMARTYALPVTGDSMEPTLPNGSYVFVDTTHTVPSPPDIYAVDYGDGLMVKRVELIPQSESVRISSDNGRYRDYELRRDDLRVYGRVVAWFQWRG